MTLAKAVGLNHVSIEVGHIAEAIAFYRSILDFEVEDQKEDRASIELGDQFIALTLGRRQAADDDRHFGLVVDDREKVRSRLSELGIAVLPGRFLGIHDPWGNHVEFVGYGGIRFEKTTAVLEAMGLETLRKSPAAPTTA